MSLYPKISHSSLEVALSDSTTYKHDIAVIQNTTPTAALDPYSTHNGESTSGTTECYNVANHIQCREAERSRHRIEPLLAGKSDIALQAFLRSHFQAINMNNMNVELVSQMWANYGRNAGFYLEGSGHNEADQPSK